MYDIEELYQEIIIDHSRNPRNFGKLDTANKTAEGYNPLCGCLLYTSPSPRD